jgi:ferritin-like protein
MTGDRPLALSDVDRDGALHDAIAALHGETRADFVRRATLGSAAMLAVLAAPAPASAATTAQADIDILNFGLRFERLQASFYTEADSMGTVAKMAARKQQWARTLGAHERAHVRIIKKILGDRAGPRPFFDFHGVTESEDGFTRTAVAMEDLTVALLSGITPQIEDRALVAALFGLLTTEARHAAWARNIVRTTPAARAFDEPRSLDDVGRLVADTHFIASTPRVRRRGRRPRMTG